MCNPIADLLRLNHAIIFPRDLYLGHRMQGLRTISNFRDNCMFSTNLRGNCASVITFLNYFHKFKLLLIPFLLVRAYDFLSEALYPRCIHLTNLVPVGRDCVLAYYFTYFPSQIALVELLLSSISIVTYVIPFHQPREKLLSTLSWSAFRFWARLQKSCILQVSFTKLHELCRRRNSRYMNELYSLHHGQL